MQVLAVGSADFIKEWAASKMGMIRRVLHVIKSLSSKHVALYLLKGAGDACRVACYLRATLSDTRHTFIDEFDAELVAAFDEILDTCVSASR